MQAALLALQLLLRLHLHVCIALDMYVKNSDELTPSTWHLCGSRLMLRLHEPHAWITLDEELFRSTVFALQRYLEDQLVVDVLYLHCQHVISWAVHNDNNSHLLPFSSGSGQESNNVV